jgi:ATP-dependent Lon protease
MDSNESIYFSNMFFLGAHHGRSEATAQPTTGQEEPIYLMNDNAELLPLLAINHSVLFPGIIMPIGLQEEQAIRLIKKIYKAGGVFGVIAQKKAHIEHPGAKDIFRIGTVAKILKVITLPDGRATAILQGQYRFKIEKIITETPHLLAHVHKLSDKADTFQSKQVRAITRSIKEAAARLIALQPEFPAEVQLVLDNVEDLNFLTYFLAFSLDTEIKNKQKILEIDEGAKRGTVLLKFLLKDVEISQLKKKIQDKVHTDINQQQRDYYIRHQIKVLQDELGESELDEEIEELRAKGDQKAWPKEVADAFYKELDKAERMSPNSPDYPVLVNHAELIVDLPWSVYTTDNMNIKEAEKILNAEHFGIEKVKERLLEYLAVLKFKKNLKGPILCLYGPPGVGKTSLAKSIAKALNRKYTRISLGGLNDEAEIRGHRKTYIGAMPGKVIKGIQKAGSCNPVFVLDELDKVSDLRGDPAAALLEVLDPEQNNAFVDNFLEIPYDLSKVLFIATANSLDTIPIALKDRLELIEVTGYTVEEKLQIARKYLFPKQRKEHGLKATNLSIQDNAIIKIIEHYTRESGVRELERKLGSVVRKVAKAMALGETYPKTIKEADIVALLGIEQYDQEVYQYTDLPGVAIGLAWTPVGGDILFIEATLSQGKGKLTLSGQLGEVMKESAITALTYLRAHAATLHIKPQVFETHDLHIHVPAGAVPKDGPSAGITLLTALASLYTQRKVKDRLAMTGEITLRGKVLPVGGIKEKILAAKRAGIKEIILSVENKKDIQEIKPSDIENILFHYAHTVEEVLDWSLESEPIKDARLWDFIEPEPMRQVAANNDHHKSA